jgi:hypothetical protein
MARLDSMTKKELSKLNFASETLLWLGAIKMVFFLLYTFWRFSYKLFLFP